MSAVATAAQTLRRAPVEPDSQTGLDYRLARQSAERMGAFRLIHDAYVRAGLGHATETGMRVTPYQILSTSQIFVGMLEREVVSTVSLIGDGELGVPMDVMFREDVDELRRAGRRVAEVSCLADRRRDSKRFLSSFRELTRLMAQYARSEGIDTLLITVHPRHAKFYAHYLGFETLTERVAECPHVEDRPAVALQLNFAHVDEHRPRCYDHYFGEWLAAEELRPYRMDPAELSFLKGVTTAAEIFGVAACGA